MLLALLLAAESPEGRILEYRRVSDQGTVEAADTLAAALSIEDDPRARVAARDALSRVDLDAEELVLLLEGSEYAEARAWAAHSLGHYGGSGAADALLAAVDDPSDLVRAEVYEALGSNRDPRAITVLQKAAVQDPDAKNREAAILAAKRALSEPSVDVPLELARLASEDENARVQAARRLGSSDDWRAVEPLIGAAQGGDTELRKAALLALGHLGDARAVGPICEVATSSSGHVRYAALAALAYLKDESATQVLVQLTSDGDASTRQLAIRALAWTNAPGTAALIRPLLQDADEHVRAEVVLSLGEIDDPARVEGLVEGLVDPSPFVRAEAARLLGKTGDVEAGAALLPLLKDRDALVRIAAAQAAADLGLDEAREPLGKLVEKTRDAEERAWYEKALSQL